MAVSYFVIPVAKDGFQQPVIDIVVSDPASPSKGDRYIVASGSSGLFAGHDNHIAWYDGNQWLFAIPSKGWLAYVISSSEYHVFDGTNWVPFSSLYSGTDEFVKADANDPTAGHLDAKVDNTTLEVDTTNHVLKVKIIRASELDLSDTYDFSSNGGAILVADPQSDYEAVNLRTLTDKLAAYAKGLDWIESVLDIQVDSSLNPGTSPNDGDRYIITNASDLNSNFGTIEGLEDNDVVQYSSAEGKWYVDYDVSAISTSTGCHTYVEAKGRNYIYNGTQWVDGGTTQIHNSLAGLQGGTTDEYYHLTQNEHDLLTTGQDATSIHHHDSRYQKKLWYDPDLGSIIVDID